MLKHIAANIRKDKYEGNKCNKNNHDAYNTKALGILNVEVGDGAGWNARTMVGGDIL